MPIELACELRRIGQAEFQDIDYLVTGLAFDVQRELGSWFVDESVYRDELARQCKCRGFTAHVEVPIHVAFCPFIKCYYLDLVVNQSVLYEMKAVEGIHPRHRSQALSYLMLTGLAHSKILNMRGPSVTCEFVSTSITTSDRYAFTVDLNRWLDLDGDSKWLKETMRALIDEWGLFLEVPLFYDAIEYFRGGKERVIQPIEIVRANQIIGHQLAHLLNAETGFKITAVTKDIPQFEKHLSKFLSITSLRAIQWINFDHHKVCFTTILRERAIHHSAVQ